MKRFLFAYAPPPAPGELLGSWVHRLAIGHGVNGSVFREERSADIDWEIEADELRHLAGGADLPIATLRAMTLSAAAPAATRADFALAAARTFPACHAYCALCGLEDREQHGEAIIRQRDAGLWRLACVEHGVLLDGVDDESEVTPAPRSPRSPYQDGRLWLGREPIYAPAFALAFERAALAAVQGQAPGVFWSVQEPRQFIEIARALAGLSLVQRRSGAVVETAAGALLGGNEIAQRGSEHFDPLAIDRVATRTRIRALLAASLLLISPQGAEHLRVLEWPPLRRLSAWRPVPVTPWEAAGAAWNRITLEMVGDIAADWPDGLRAAANDVIGARLASMGRAFVR